MLVTEKRKSQQNSVNTNHFFFKSLLLMVVVVSTLTPNLCQLFSNKSFSIEPNYSVHFLI
jgi:cytochrome c biogenesis factor